MLHKCSSGADYSQVVAERDAGRRIIAEQSDQLRELADRFQAAVAGIAAGHAAHLDVTNELERVTRERDEAVLRIEQLLDARRLDDLHEEPDMDRCG
ncbi:hypothetical protein SEA_ALLEYCAT_44 [Mycobacterium phage AlleyCat]|uniref:Uncharacterized protein n=2 Tax=Kratiovirus larva TaxID=1056831 RepID=A0A221J770_9CAUD|nr:hypothetical protein CL76_gp58 [Mycobacterium phage Larva]AEL19753.1 hypothetical protein LARVA_44 [Mycobacterium phage Larva]ASM62550.1 hypothetical protein SEA_ALLEYCAT_44 [Mycobacterium phage AlleyCat]WAB09725.1 hypothetical protein SEA_DADOSKY_44 [Mycobacterium phage Dadosky]